MKLISYDVGIKNLAYCIVDENMKILKWDIIDLLNINEFAKPDASKILIVITFFYSIAKIMYTIWQRHTLQDH